MSGAVRDGSAAPPDADHPWLPDREWPPTAPFFAAAQDQRLAFPQCSVCGRYQWYPQDMCPQCRAMAFAWVTVAPQGYVFSATVLRRAFVPGFTARLPLQIVLARFPHVPGVTLVTDVLDPPPAGVGLDVGLTIEFPEVAPGVRLPAARVVEVPA